MVVFGITKVEKVKMLAELSGLKLEAELKRVHASGTYKKKIKGEYFILFVFLCVSLYVSSVC